MSLPNHKPFDFDSLPELWEQNAAFNKNIELQENKRFCSEWTGE